MEDLTNETLGLKEDCENLPTIIMKEPDRGPKWDELVKRQASKENEEDKLSD
jgi:hypothetical protein